MKLIKVFLKTLLLLILLTLHSIISIILRLIQMITFYLYKGAWICEMWFWKYHNKSIWHEVINFIPIIVFNMLGRIFSWVNYISTKLSLLIMKHLDKILPKKVKGKNSKNS